MKTWSCNKFFCIFLNTFLSSVKINFHRTFLKIREFSEAKLNSSEYQMTVNVVQVWEKVWSQRRSRRQKWRTNVWKKNQTFPRNSRWKKRKTKKSEEKQEFIETGTNLNLLRIFSKNNRGNSCGEFSIFNKLDLYASFRNWILEAPTKQVHEFSSCRGIDNRSLSKTVFGKCDC